ncbi:MAG TPA: hypothetical protein VMT06_00675 [Candidatus Eisenbacteria bacterium]|nr:hypothetical protein [Candidatus Eisenbacteria bacterium]
MGATEETEREDKFVEESSKTPVKKHQETVTKTLTCSHHLGYLSERTKKESIPEECIMCDNIVKCMLKAVTG